MKDDRSSWKNVPTRPYPKPRLLKDRTQAITTKPAIRCPFSQVSNPPDLVRAPEEEEEEGTPSSRTKLRCPQPENRFRLGVPRVGTSLLMEGGLAGLAVGWRTCVERTTQTTSRDIPSLRRILPTPSITPTRRDRTPNRCPLPTRFPTPHYPTEEVRIISILLIIESPRARNPLPATRNSRRRTSTPCPVTSIPRLTHLPICIAKSPNLRYPRIRPRAATFRCIRCTRIIRVTR